MMFDEIDTVIVTLCYHL